MKNLKSVVALLVVAAMLFTSVASMAAYSDVDANATYATAVDTLSALSLLKGDDQGKFNPDQTITRAESAAVIVRMLGLEDQAAAAKGATQFTDVATDHWGSGYINMAAQSGIIKGHGDGTFGPEDPVTYEQMVKMLVCALGYEPRALAKGGYPTGYLIVANDVKMTKGVTGTSGESALRKVVAQLAFNALDIPLMEQQGYGTDAKYVECHGKNGNDYKTLLTSKLDVYKVYGEVTETDSTMSSLKAGTIKFKLTKDENVGVANDDFEFYLNENNRYVGPTVTARVGDTNAKDMLAYTCYAYLKPVENSTDYEVLAINEVGVNTVLEIAAEDINTVKDNNDGTYTIDYDEDETTTDKVTAYTGSIYLNGINFDGTVDEELFMPNEGGLRLFLDDNDDATKVFIDSYVSGVVSSVSSSNQSITLKTSVTIPGASSATRILKLDTQDNKKLRLSIKDTDGKDMKIEDLDEWDVLSIKANASRADDKVGNTVDIIVSRDKVEGTITNSKTVDAEKVYTIGGKEYKAIKGDGGYDLASLALSTEATFYLNAFGKIAACDTTSVTNLDNYAVIMDAGEAGMDGYDVKVLGKDGIKTYTLSSDRNVKFNNEKNTVSAKTVYNEIKTRVATKEAATSEAARNEALADLMATIKVNSDGVITEVVFVQRDNLSAKDFDGKYKSGTNSIGSLELNKDAKVYYAPADLDAKNSDYSVKTISSLSNDSNYVGYVFGTNSRNEVTAIMVTNTTSGTNDKTPIALITAVGDALDEEGVMVTEYTYYSEGKVGTVLAEDNGALAVGSVIKIALDSDGMLDDNSDVLFLFDTSDKSTDEIGTAGGDLGSVASNTNPKRKYIYGDVTYKNSDSNNITVDVLDSNISDIGNSAIIALNDSAYAYTIDRNKRGDDVFVDPAKSTIDDIIERTLKTDDSGNEVYEHRYIFAELDDSDTLLSVIVIIPMK